MTLEGYQECAVGWLAKRRRGMVVAPAGSGKTVIAAAALERVVLGKDRTEVVKVGWMANTIEQCEQARKALGMFPGLVGKVESWVECAQAGMDWSDCDVLIVDECHHLPADSWLKQVQSGPGCRWGFTATPWGNDADRNGILREMFDGEVWVVERGEVTARLAPALVRMLDATDEGVGEVIDREIEREIQRLSRWSPRPEHELRITTTWQCCVKIGIVGNRARNEAAVVAARRHAGDHVLVLVNEIEHGERLAGRIGAKLCFSKMGKKARREVLDEFKSGELPCLVATSLADEGLDLPIADVLVLVSGGRSEGKTVQRTGRVLRQFPGKPCGIIYDFLDRKHACMNNHAKDRMRVYRSLGYEVRMPWEQEGML